MITFSLAIVILIAGYFIYGKFVSRLFGEDNSRSVPSQTMADGVDFVSMPTWKVFTIQFMNIAGLGPVFGAIMGAKFGTASYLWIVFGCIFAGAVHDYLAAMMSLRNGGESLPNLIGRYLGSGIQHFFTIFTLVVLILVGCVFVSQPADLLASITGGIFGRHFWMIAIFLYYLVATLFPIDKIIGHIYPIFGLALLFMAAGILGALFVYSPDIPEIWEGFGEKYESQPVFPIMFVSIACGAISGFHATQSPMMARCVRNEKAGRKVFYGAMICEGLVALIWAAAATAYFQDHGTSDSASTVAMNISRDWLGSVGGVIAILGIIAAPISSGDTAFRSARLMVSDSLHFTQKGVLNRMAVSIPLFTISLIVLYISIYKPDGFAVIWRYFSWSNQTLSVFTLWALTIYLSREGKNFLVTLIPATFMTCVSVTYLLLAPECCDLPAVFSYPIGIVVALNFLILFLRWKYRYNMHFPIKTNFFR